MFKLQDLLVFGLKFNKINISNCHLLEVVDRGSETQLQVGENLLFQCSGLKVNH